MTSLKALLCRTTPRFFSSTVQKNTKVAVLGAGGGIGQPLSMLLKLSPHVTQLSLYDINHAPGVASDLSHINVKSEIRGSNGPENLKRALFGMEVVVIPAGMPRKPGMSRDDLFNVNASIVKDLVEACAKNCPKALIAIITNPVNTVVPIAAEVLKKMGVFDPGRLFGVTTLDLVRASTFVGNLKKLDPKSVHVPCIGGHSGQTILPLFSQCRPKFDFTQEEIEALTKRVQDAGTEVVKAKAGAGSATLSTAYAASRLTNALCRALEGEGDVVECSYVASNVTEVKYFSSPIILGKNGVMKILPLPPLSNYESEALKKAIPELKKNIEKGEKFKI